jgi:IclR family transcriptional regulator, blcABC operon repressor
VPIAARRKPENRRGSSLVPAVDRAIALLGLLESAPQQMFTLADISRRLSIPKSTALNICGAMAMGRLIRRSYDGYQLGRRLVQLGSAYVSSIDIVREFYEVSRPTIADLKAMIQLAVLDDEMNAIYLARQDCFSGLRLGLQAEIGRRVPANCTAAGKALLAALPLDELERRLAKVSVLPALTGKSIVARPKLLKELEAIRKRGYASEEEEVLPGVSCIARAATTGHREDGMLAVSITASNNGLTRRRRQLMNATLNSLVEQLEQRL